MFDITDDYLAANEPLKAALETVPNIKQVNYITDLADLGESSQRTPCLHFLYFGDQLPDTANAGNLMQIKQTWLVILVVRQGRKENAGPHLVNTIRAIAGKKAGDTGPWLRVNSPIKPRFTKGFAYYPLAFTCQMRMKGAHL